jgi:transposase
MYKIVTCLLMIQEGRHFVTIAKQLNICCRTVYDWLKKFMIRGFSWLLGKCYKGRGRKPRLTDNQKEELYEVVVASPQACGYGRGIWNSAMIVIEIEKRFRITYSPRYLFLLGITYYGLLIFTYQGHAAGRDSALELQIENNKNQRVLKYQQEQYRRPFEDFSIKQQRTLNQRLNRQRLQQKQLQRSQEIEDRAQRFQFRSPTDDSATARKSGDNRLKFYRTQEKQLLQFKIQRKTWPFHRNLR